MSWRISIVAIALFVSTTAVAADGVFEINQVCATTTGCFAGDGAGFPVTIAQPGSYRLTSNLTVTTPGVTAILGTTGRGTLDLGGFVITGPGTCTGIGASLACTGGGNASGISVGGGLRLHSGTIRRFGTNGVLMSPGGEVDSLFVEENGVDGIQVADGIVTRVIAKRNGRFGITVFSSVVKDCVASENKVNGISGTYSRVADVVATGNGETGIDVRVAAVVSDSIARMNGQGGINVTEGVVRNNASDQNGLDGIRADYSVVVGNTSTNNGQAGIAALASGSVVENFARANGYVGLYLTPELGGPAAAYRGNVVSGNTGGTVVNGVNLFSNSCNGAVTCP